ncbi:putative TfdA family taurine dioxygenase [Rhodotorula sp. JG-1b]|nr:putative TfdA family taurine dioxygenase [Rhodotorula sp. JG-1b]
MLATQTTMDNNLAPHATWSLPVKGDASTAHADHAVKTDLLTPPFTRPSSPSPARAQASERYAPPSTTFLNPQDYPRRQLTPAVGLRFEPEFQLKDILDLPEGDAKREALLKELAYTISLHGVCAFPAQALSADDLLVLAAALGRASGAPADSDLHIHPTAELGENGRPTVAAISNVAGSMGRQINFRDERSEFASMNVHADISWEQRPARYSMLRMRTLPPTGGDTLFYSTYAHYDKLSEPMKEMLSGLTARHSGSMFREQSRRFGYKLHLGPRGAPENVGDSFEASHPVIRTNAVTGFHTLHVNQTFTERIEGLTIDESRTLLDYLFRLQAQSHDAQVRYSWSEGDLCIWDNSCVLHSATFDYDPTLERSGDRAVFVGETPYFDREHGKSRKQTLQSVV